MTVANFILCFTETASFEGGFANNPHDPGHATMDGVTQAVYTEWLTTHGRHDAPVRGISLADRQAIYRAYFWNEVRGDDLYEGLDLIMADTAWGSGPVEAIKLLQRAVGVEDDGKFGEGTLKAVQEYRATNRDIVLINKVCDERMKFFQSLSTWKYFGHGWTTRLNGIEAKAIAMRGIANKLPPKVTPSAAAPAHVEQKEGSLMSTPPGQPATPASVAASAPSTTSLLDTLENLLTAAIDSAPEVSKDFKAAVAEFQKLKASPVGVSLSNIIGQLFSHSTATNTIHLPATNVAIVAPNISS